MYEQSEGRAATVPTAARAAGMAGSPVDAAFVELLDELFAGPRVTYAPTREEPIYHGGHGYRGHRRRRFVLRGGTDLDDPH